MSESVQNRLARQLLQQDKPFTETEYREYRMRLEQELQSVQCWERLALRAASVAIVWAFVAMVIGGTGIAGEFDPWSKDATVFSILLGLSYVVAWIIFLWSVASTFSRFNPRIKDLKEQIRDASLLALHTEIAELKKQVAELIPKDRAK